jgi:hypothetical protein
MESVPTTVLVERISWLSDARTLYAALEVAVECAGI